MKVNVGDKLRFRGEKQAYTVQACDERYAICTKPFNLRHTVLYSIVDFHEQIRGTENLIFCKGFETRQKCQEALQRIRAGDTEISYRNRTRLEVMEVEGE